MKIKYIKNISRSIILGLILAISIGLGSCSDDDVNNSSLTLTGRTSRVTLYVAGIDEPLFSESELTPDANQEIIVSPLLPESYKVEYYVIATGNDYWPVPKVKVFQIMPNEQKMVELD
ncbi:hypothetical protein FNH22_29860 [Fulvivirga sp. M361]|uniref:hypothetical protein n=1 Tax=Fulvivirga sp. M361 TaxID=2594266 RepID=UPI00117ABF8F|nr:hypothetical protein [Fulvivirga sp. M361]TRX48072.1 hypothetical protein FNH22_29860 [Fulvivirga sp. M361]